jgi:hypothetical protein
MDYLGQFLGDPEVIAACLAAVWPQLQPHNVVYMLYLDESTRTNDPIQQALCRLRMEQSVSAAADILLAYFLAHPEFRNRVGF